MFIGPCIIVIVEERKTNLMSLAILFHLRAQGDRGGTVVKVLCYKSEGRWFDPS